MRGLAILGFVLAACSDADVVALRLEVQPDLSGTMTVSALLIPGAPNPTEPLAKGVTFDSRVNLHCSRGKFAALDKLGFEDIELRVGKGEQGMAFVSIRLPRGDKARWFHSLAPSREERMRVARTFDPTGTIEQPGAVIKFDIQLPGMVVGNGVLPRARGLNAEVSGQKATLVVPVDAAARNEEAFVWDITWRSN